MTTYLLIAAILLQLADAATTIYALRNKLGTEANKALAKLMGVVGRDAALLVTKLAAIGALLYYRDTLTAVPLALLCAGYAAIVVNNVRVILRAKEFEGSA